MVMMLAPVGNVRGEETDGEDGDQHADDGDALQARAILKSRATRSYFSRKFR